MTTFMAREIEVAASWWLQVARDGESQDNGTTRSADATLTDIKGMVAGTMLKEKAAVAFAGERGELFQAALAGLLKRLANGEPVRCDDSYTQQPIRPNTAYSCIYFGVDYDPEILLRYACDLAGIDERDYAAFPWKTRMKLEPGHVEVKRGYNAPWTVLFDEAEQKESEG